MRRTVGNLARCLICILGGLPCFLRLKFRLAIRAVPFRELVLVLFLVPFIGVRVRSRTASLLPHRKSFATVSSVHAANAVKYIIELDLKYAGMISAHYDLSPLFHTRLSWLGILLLDFSQLQVYLPTEKSRRKHHTLCCETRVVL